MNNFSVPAAGNPVKITPSANYHKLIENRAIPFYYAKPSTIVAKWNYNRWLQGTYKHVLGYHASDYAGGNEMVVTPLSYSIDVNDFFRIEGHIGRPYSEALKLVDEIRKGYNLPFDIVAIRMGEVDLSDIDIDDYSCQFGDLEAIFNAFKAEQNCLYSAVAKFFSNFDTRTADSFVKTDYKKYSRKSVKEFLDVAGKGIPMRKHEKSWTSTVFRT